jgi:hypothetical protein
MRAPVPRPHSATMDSPTSNKQPGRSSAATCSASAAFTTSIPFVPTVGNIARPAVSQRDKEEIGKDVQVIKTPDECDQAEEGTCPMANAKCQFEQAPILAADLRRDVQDGAGTSFLHLQGDERWAMHLQLHCFNESVPQALPVLRSGRAIIAPVFDDGG